MKQVQIEKHSTPQSILFHLLPGILVGGFYFLARQPVARLGYPSVFAQMLAFALVLVPLELGFLFFQAKKKTGSFRLRDILRYRNSIPWWQYVVWPILIVLVVGAVFTLLKPVDALLQTRLFYWMPEINSGLDGQYSRPVLIVTYTLFLIFNVFLAPIVEELYFRGYLLPRMQGRLAPLFHSFLFAAVHTFTPWMLITRTVGLLPLIYGTTRKNLYVGMIVHILGNSVGFLTGMIYIVKMT
jgi:membrane protease YdiL (CAAX protease family)